MDYEAALEFLEETRDMLEDVAQGEEAMRVFVPTDKVNEVERLFAGWNGPKLYCRLAFLRGRYGFMVTTTPFPPWSWMSSDFCIY